MEARPDAFLAERPLQPKKDIADYVESSGLPAAKRFRSLSGARKTKQPFIIRSEHPQDYEGSSGLLDSIVISKERAMACKGFLSQVAMMNLPNFLDAHQVNAWQRSGGVDGVGKWGLEYAVQKNKIKSTEEITQALLNVARGNTIQIYCLCMGITQEQFQRETSCSIWEYIPGNNMTVVADSAIAGRYNVFSVAKEDSRQSYIYQWPDHEPSLSSELALKTRHAVNLYENVRNLPKFNPQHCPIMEIQVDSENLAWFLQYHRSRDFSPATHVLTGNEDGVWSEGFVRGSTPPEGSLVKIKPFPSYTPGNLPPIEGGASGHRGDYQQQVMDEIMTQRRQIQLLPVATSGAMYTSHMTVSQRSKPGVTIEMPLEKILTKEQINWYRDNPEETVLIKVISDGRRAVLKVIH